MTKKYRKRLLRRQVLLLVLTAALVLVSGCTGEGEEASEAPGADAEASEEAGPTDEPEFADPVTIPAGTVIDSGEDADRFFLISEITDDVYARIDGKSFQEGGKIAREDLRYLRVLYVDFDGETRSGELIVNERAAEDALAVFRELYERKYAIRKMVLVDEYYDIDHPKYDHLDRGNKADCVSIEDDNTSAFNYRTASDNDGVLSNHALGLAIDLNPYENPYVWADGTLDGPDGSAEYLDRSKASEDNHMLRDGDTAVTAFKTHGFSWGGDWQGNKDYQHFDYEK